MQMHKAQRHSGSHANLAVNRAHKRLALKRQARVTISGNRAERRLDADVKGRYEEQQAAKVEANLQRQRREAQNLADNDTSTPV